MRVLLITGSYPPMKCGVGDYSYYLAKALTGEPDIHVGVLTSASGRQGSQANGVELFPVVKQWSLSEARRIIETIRTWSPDIVHLQYPTQGYGNGFLPWLSPMICFLLGTKVVQTWHEGYGKRSAPKLLLKSIIPGALVFVRPRYKEHLDRTLHWALWNKKKVLIPNASSIPRADLGEHKKDELRTHYLKKQKRLIVFFGFLYPHKGVEHLFEIADPDSDQIVIAGELDEKKDYPRKIIECASVESWRERVTFTGFLSDVDLAALLAVADAVILPFRMGGGEWNTSIHGAVLNGAFVITTSLTRSGYDEKRNVYFAKVDGIQEMKAALDTYAGKRRPYDADIDRDEWRHIAKEHHALYESLLSV